MITEIVSDNQSHYLESLSEKQLVRLYGNIYARYTAGGGYQPFGYDWSTMAAVAPHFYNIMMRMRSIAKRMRAVA